MSGHRAWNVYAGGKLIDTVFYDADCDADYVRRGLIDHDGYPADIKVKGNAPGPASVKVQKGGGK